MERRPVRFVTSLNRVGACSWCWPFLPFLPGLRGRIQSLLLCQHLWFLPFDICDTKSAWSVLKSQRSHEIQSSCHDVREHLAATALPLRAWHCLAQRLVFLRAHICLATEYSDLEIVSRVALVTYIRRMFAAAAGSKWATDNCTKIAVTVTGSLAGIVLWEGECCW